MGKTDIDWEINSGLAFLYTSVPSQDQVIVHRLGCFANIMTVKTIFSVRVRAPH